MRDINNYVKNYVKEPFEETMVQIRKRKVLSQINRYPHNTILEIGCGMSPLFLDIRDYSEMIVVEPGEGFAKNAEMLARNSDGNVSIIEGFLEDQVDRIKELGFEFDFIVLSGVLHELDDPLRMLQSIYSLCGTNSIVHINVPNARSLHRLIAKEMGLIEDIHDKSEQMIKQERRRTYDADLLKADVESAGFSIIDSGSYFLKPLTHLQMQNCLDEGIIDEKVLMGFERVMKYLPQYGAEIYVNVSL